MRDLEMEEKVKFSNKQKQPYNNKGNAAPKTSMQFQVKSSYKGFSANPVQQ